MALEQYAQRVNQLSEERQSWVSDAVGVLLDAVETEDEPSVVVGSAVIEDDWKMDNIRIFSNFEDKRTIGYFLRALSEWVSAR